MHYGGPGTAPYLISGSEAGSEEGTATGNVIRDLAYCERGGVGCHWRPIHKVGAGENDVSSIGVACQRELELAVVVRRVG